MVSPFFNPCSSYRPDHKTMNTMNIKLIVSYYVMDGIKVFADDCEFDISGDSAEEMEKLVDLLEPNIPVMVQEGSYSSLRASGGHSTKRTLFLSDGKLVEGRKFPPREGKMNKAFAVAYGKGQRLQALPVGRLLGR